MRIFVSYARVNRAYCVQIVDILDFHDIWYDQNLTAGGDWWKQIQQRLDWCEGFIYLISAVSLASDYCRKEFETARALGKHIFPILIEENLDIPEALHTLHYVDISKGLTVEAVRQLVRAIFAAEHQDRQNRENTMAVEIIGSDLTAAVRAMELGQYERAIDLIQQLKTRDDQPAFINLDQMLLQAQAALERLQQRQQMEREYRDIYYLIHSPITHTIGKDAFAKFHQTYPDYDPDNLAVYLDPLPEPQKRPAKPESGLKRLNKVSARIPLLEWCEIPGGMVRIESGNRGGAKPIDSFLMARYPITNMQYHLFLKAPNGYCDPAWWDFAPDARAWRENTPKPAPPAFKGADRPRENVSWYDARAFCNWLSALLKAEITLPTLRQRQHAVMGDDDRGYPWGNVFDKNRCNTHESGTRMTTVVNHYPEGVNKYDVYDLAGNIWEWCMEVVPDEEAENDPNYKVMVHGGAFFSPHTRAHVAHYLLVPPQTRFASIGFRVICTLPGGQ